MAQLIGGILCDEVVNEQVEEWDVLQGPTQQKVFHCLWTQRFQVAQGLLGLASTTHVGGLITLLTPLPYPEMPTSYCTHVTIKGVGQPTQGAIQFQFTDAYVTAHYNCLPWSFAGITANDFNNQIDPAHPYIYAEQSMSFTSEWVTIPGKKVYYASSGKPLNQDYGFRSPIVNFTISLKYVPYIPAPAVILAAAAPINSVTYLGCPAGYLLFNGGETHQVRMSDGSLTQNWDTSWSFRPIAPWDYVYNGDLPGWDQVVNAASGGVNIQKRSDLSTVIPAYYNM